MAASLTRPDSLRSSELLRFILVGSIGFCIDGGAMLVLSARFDWTPLTARVIGFPLAVTVTWLLNRTWTFRTGRERGVAGQYGAYLLIQLGGLLINFSVFALLVTRGGWLAGHPIIALAIGAGLALAFTFLCSRRLAFSGRPR